MTQTHFNFKNTTNIFHNAPNVHLGGGGGTLTFGIVKHFEDGASTHES